MNLTEKQKANPALTGAMLGMFQGFAIFGALGVIVLLIIGESVAAIPFLVFAVVGVIGWWKMYGFGLYFKMDDFRSSNSLLQESLEEMRRGEYTVRIDKNGNRRV